MKTESQEIVAGLLMQCEAAQVKNKKVIRRLSMALKIARLLERGMTWPEIASRLQRTQRAIDNVIPSATHEARRALAIVAKRQKLEARNQAVVAYVLRGRTYEQAHQKFGLSVSVICRIARKASLPPKPEGSQGRPRRQSAGSEARSAF